MELVSPYCAAPYGLTIMQGGPCTAAGGMFAVAEGQGSENLYGNHWAKGFL